MLQLEALTIVEWSHNGTCRLWTQNDKNCPQFYKATYSRIECALTRVMSSGITVTFTIRGSRRWRRHP